MGGTLTVYVAGSDNRVKAGAPSVGGSGFRTAPRPLLPQDNRETPQGDVTLFNATLGLESYAPQIQAPLLWLGATNDFHGIMDDTYLLSADNPHHWEFSTRKLSDPKWQGQSDQRLTLDVQAEQPNELVIVLTENFFRSYRGP